MDKQTTDELIRKLVENRLTKTEFDEIISGIVDKDKSVFFEFTLRDHFEENLRRFQNEESVPKVDSKKVKGG